MCKVGYHTKLKFKKKIKKHRSKSQKQNIVRGKARNGKATLVLYKIRSMNNKICSFCNEFVLGR